MVAISRIQMIYFPIKYNIYICYCDCFGRNVATLQNILIHTYLPNSYYTSNEAIRVQTDYDVIDRPIATHWADGAESSISYGIGDDAFGVSRLLQNRTDENGKEWQQYTSPQGWLTTSIAPDEATTTFRYDPLGQLLQSTDPDGLTTIHIYDGFGRRTKRVHPDAGTTHWTYDAAGNMIASATNLQLNRGEQTTYEYDYTHPVHIHYPQYPQNDVYYTYDSVGRLSMVRDVTGTERMEYDDVGNVSLSERTIGIPTENNAYRFRTRFTYDSFGRMRRIVYPDGEVVDYGYENGLLRTIAGNASIPYIQDISYDLYDNVSYIRYGNGLQTNIFYDDVHLRPRNRQTYTGQDVPLQDISYTYDGVGNITRINQSVDPFGNMGGAYDVRYTYDDQYRLTRAVQSSTQLGGYDYSMSYSPSGLVSTKDCQEINTSLTYGYQYNSDNRVSPFASHRVATVFPTNTEDVALTVWNANGELTSIVQPFQDNFRRHLWNEVGQLAYFVSNEQCGYYAYDAQGNRAYKLTGTVTTDQYDAGTMQATAYFDDVTLYVNPYMVVTPRGYTKHYYNGSQRIAARLGGQWAQDSTQVYIPNMRNVAASLWSKTVNTHNLNEQEIPNNEVYIRADGGLLPACQYSPNITRLSGRFSTNLLSPVFSGQASERTLTDTIGIYFYHPDHLGSASWITNSQGQAVQYIHYMPYGELWVNQQSNQYDERFKFIGKERDTETGYDCFGARFYLSLLGIWLSPDPLLDKYPSISSYAYCGWNPLKRIDFDGREWKDIEGNVIKDHTDIKAYIYYDPKSFEGQSLQMYKDAVSLYGEGSVALSDVTTQGEFVTDWKNMASPDIQEINVNYHGNNQTIMLNSSEGQYITATGNGLSNVSNTPAFNVQDLPNPIGNVMNAQLNLNTCRSNNHFQHPLAGSGLTLAEAFRYKFNFNVVRGTYAGVSYNRFTKHPEPQHFWQKWDYLYRPYPSQSPRVGLPPR